MAKTGNSNTDILSISEQKDIDILQEEGGIGSYLQWWFDDMKSIWDAWKQFVTNTYDIYTNDDIQDSAAYTELNNVVSRKEKRLNSLSMDESLSDEQYNFKLTEIENDYKMQEETLLNQSIKGDNKMDKFNKARYWDFDWAWEPTDEQEMIRRISLEADSVVDSLDKTAWNVWILSNDELSYKDKVKSILWKELGNFQINKRKAVADLQSIKASKWAILNTIKDFDEAIALQTEISKYSLTGVNEWILEWDALTDFIIGKIGTTKMNRAVELKNQMNIDLQARQAKANIAEWNLIVGGLEWSWLAGSVLAKHLKSGFSILKDDKERFKDDFSWIQLSDKQGLEYILDYTMDNFDDISANIIGSVATGWAIHKGTDLLGAVASKVTRLDDFLKVNRIGKRIADSKITKGAKYFKREISAWAWANQVINVAMNDVNSEERMVSDAIMDVALSPVFDWIFSSLGYGIGRVNQWISNSWLLDDFIMTDNKLIRGFQEDAAARGTPITEIEAKTLLDSTQDYLKRTDSPHSNKEVFKFIEENADRLEAEWQIIGGWMVIAMRNYQAKSWLEFNVDVDVHREVLSNKGSIDLSANTIWAKDIKSIFNKVNSLTVKNTHQETTKYLLEAMKVDKKIIKDFIEKNTDISEALHQAIVDAQLNVKKVSAEKILTSDNNPLDAIADLSDSLAIISTKTLWTEQMISIYRHQIIDGESKFITELVKKSDLAIEGYQIFHKGTGESDKVFINDTLVNKVTNNTFSNNKVVRDLITNGFANQEAWDNLEKINEALKDVFSYDIANDPDNIVKLKVVDWKYTLEFNWLAAVTKWKKDWIFTYNGTQVKIWTESTNKILFELVLNRADAFTSPIEFKEIVSTSILRLNRIIVKNWDFSINFRWPSVDDWHLIAKQNVNNTLKGVLDRDTLKDFNSIIDNTLLRPESLVKLRTLSSLWTKNNTEAYWILTESLMLRAAERFSNSDIRRIIDSINDDPKIEPWSKQEAIVNLLVGKEPINVFDSIWRWNSWSFPEKQLKALGIKPLSDIFELNNKQVDEFIIAMTKNKEGLLWLKELKEYREWMVAKFKENTDKAVSFYSDNVIHAILNPDGMTGIMSSLNSKWGKPFEEVDYLTDIQKVFDSDLPLTEVVSEVTVLMSGIKSESLWLVQKNKINAIVDKIRKEQNKLRWDDTATLTWVTKNLDSLVSIVDRNVKLDFEWGWNQLPYDSQIKGSDNIIRKSLNYILNPYQGSQLKNLWVSKAVDDFINKNILGTDSWFLALTEKHLNQTPEKPYTPVKYQEEVEALTDKLREFIYPEASSIKNFTDNSLKKTIKERDRILTALKDEISEYVANDTKIAILNKDWTIANVAQKTEIVGKSLTNKSIMRSLQTRLAKKNFDWYEINFKKGWVPTPNKWIMEHRTIYDHFTNIGAKPLVMEWNATRSLPLKSRESYRIANNLVGWIKVFDKNFEKFNTSNGKEVTDTETAIKKELKTYLEESRDDLVDNPKALNKEVDDIYAVSKSMIEREEYVPGFINLMNVGEKDSFWAYTPSFQGKEDASIKKFNKFMNINDEHFTWEIVKELNMEWTSLSKVAKRIATITAESEALLPWSEIPIRNYILEEPQYIDAILQWNTEGITKNSLFIRELDKEGQRIYNTLSEDWHLYLSQNYEKELRGFKWDFDTTVGSKDFEDFNWAIVDLLTTAYSDWVSFLHPDQIKFYSQYQWHVDATWKFPLKMHHYKQGNDWNVLYKTNFNSYTKDMESQMKTLVGDSYDFSSTRLIWEKSEKLKTYGNDWFLKLKDKYITINGISHKVKCYVDTNTSFDRHASSESETHAEANGITKQVDVRTHWLGSEFILRTKMKFIKDTTDTIRNTFRLDSKLDATLFSDFEDLSNFVLNEVELPGSSLATVNASLNEQLKSLKELIEKPKDEWLGFRWVMQPRINIRNKSGEFITLADDELAVSPKRFESMKGKMMEIDWEHYVSTYRNPVPNTENMTINKVVKDYSMVSEEDVAIGSWNVFVNKQADFDWDHLNVTYINNPVYVKETIDEKKPTQLWGLWMALGTIMNIEQWRISTVKWRAEKIQSLTSRIYTTENASELQEEITTFVSDWIKEQWEGWIPQVRVPVAQVVKEWGDVGIKKAVQLDTTELSGKPKVDTSALKEDTHIKKPITTLIQASNNAITGKDNIGKVDSFIRTLDLVRKYGWEYNNARLIVWDNPAEVLAHKQKIQSAYKQQLSYSLNKDKRILESYVDEDWAILKQYTAKHAALDLQIKADESVIDTLVNTIGNTTHSSKYKSLAAGLEQQTLDLASQGKDKLDEWWEEALLSEVFWENAEDAFAIMNNIWADTSKVYNWLWDKDVLKYWKTYEDWEWTKIDLALLGQHNDLYNELSKTIEVIYDDLSSIKRVRADKEFFWFTEWFWDKGSFYEIAWDAVLPYRVKGWMIELANGKPTTLNVVDWSFSWIPWIRKWWDKDLKIKWKEDWGYVFSVENQSAFNKYLKSPEAIKIKGINNKWEITNNNDVNQSLQNYPFPGIMKDNKTDWVWMSKVINETLFKDAVKEFKIDLVNNSVPVHGSLTRANIAELLTAKKNKEDKFNTIIIPIDKENPFKAKWFIATKTKDWKHLEISINTKLDKRHEVIKDMLELLPDLTNLQKNAILLRNNLQLDDTLLTRPQKLKLIFTHYLMRDKDLKESTDAGVIFPLMRENLEDTIRDVSIEDISDADKVALDKLKWEVWEQSLLKTMDLKVEDELYVNSDKQVEKDTREFHVNPAKREFDLESTTGLTMNDYWIMSKEVDNYIDNVGRYNTTVISSKVINVFKDLMLRNQELKNNATFDLYEWFNDVQKEFPKIDKIRRRQLDNHVFMAIYKSWGNPTEANLKLYGDNHWPMEEAYVNAIHKFIYNKPDGKQTIAELFGAYEIDLNPSLRFDDWEWELIKNIDKRFSSSLIEDIVNLHHKTEKIAFYEKGIYDKETFEKEYKRRVEEKWDTVDLHDMNTMYDIIFEYDLIKNNSAKKALNLMRSTTFSTTLWALSWITWAWFLMGLMQIPSELLRLWSFSKHNFDPLALTNTMDKYRILKSTWIEAWIHFWPIEANPQLTHEVMHKIFSLWSNTLKDSVTIKKLSALASNPLIITDLVVDSARKRTAFWNMISLMWFKSTEDFASKLDTLPANERTDLLNRVRLWAELKYHELSGWVTAGSYLFRETTFARVKKMLPFSYLMNWALHTQSTTYGSAKQMLWGMKKIYQWDVSTWFADIKNSDMFQRTLGQSLVIAGLYAKLNSYDEYDGEFKTRKDLNEFVKTLNSNILALEMFYPIKAMEKAYEQEGWLIAKVASGLWAVSNSTFRELDLIWMIAEEAWTAHRIPGYSAWEAITNWLLAKSAKGLAYSKMIEVESHYPEFSRRSQIDQMFGADNPNFDEQFYKDIYNTSKGEMLDGLWKSGNGHLLFNEVMSSMPIIRHISNLVDGWTSYSFFDKQVREINKKLTGWLYDKHYEDPSKMLYDLYRNGDWDRVWSYTKNFATKFWELDFKDKKLLETTLSKYIPEIKHSSYGQLTESIMVGEAINELGVEGYLKSITSWTNSENNRYIKQLLTKIQLNSPAKLPYVLGILLQQEEYENKTALKKAWYEYEGALESQTQLALLLKYKDMVKGSNPMMAQLLWYTVLNEHPELKDTMLTKGWYLSQTIADRITTRLMMTQAYEKWENHAKYIGWRMGSITNNLSRRFADWDINEGVFKSSLLDIYRLASEEVQEWNFTPDQKLEIKVALYKSLGDHAYVLYEDPKLGQAYEAARINLAHKLYQDTSILEKYINDAQVKAADWDITDPNYKKGYSSASKKYSTYRAPSSWWGSKWYWNGYLQWAANNAQRLLGNPKTNFPKIFKPSYMPYSGSKSNPYGFKYTVQDSAIAIEYFRAVAESQFSRDIFEKKNKPRSSDVFRTSRRKSELTKQDYKNVGRQNFRGFLSKGLMRWLPGSKEG